MIETVRVLPPVDPALAARLAADPDGVLERIAEEACVSTFEVVRALPAARCTIIDAAAFDDVMADLTTWGDVLLIVHTPSIVLECKGPIPPGTHGRGYFNLSGQGHVGGHIRADRCRQIAFLDRPFMGRRSCSIQFFDETGSAMFKVFVARDAARNLLSDQVERFHKLRGRLCD